MIFRFEAFLGICVVLNALHGLIFGQLATIVTPNYEIAGHVRVIDHHLGYVLFGLVTLSTLHNLCVRVKVDLLIQEMLSICLMFLSHLLTAHGIPMLRTNRNLLYSVRIVITHGLVVVLWGHLLLMVVVFMLPKGITGLATTGLR